MLVFSGAIQLWMVYAAALLLMSASMPAATWADICWQGTCRASAAGC